MYSRDQILSELTQICKKYAIISEDISCLDNEKGLQDYGFNSVDFLKLIAGVEEKYNFDFEDQDLVSDRFKTMGEMVDYILIRIQTEL